MDDSVTRKLKAKIADKRRQEIGILEVENIEVFEGMLMEIALNYSLNGTVTFFA